MIDAQGKIQQEVEGWTFSKMRADHADAVGRLHVRYMERSLLGTFGDGVVGPLYASLLESGYGAGFVAEKGDVVMGFSFGRYGDSISLASAVARSWRRMLRPLLWLGLRRPGALAQVIARLGETGHPPFGAGIGELISVVVADAARGTSASTRLAEMLFEHLESSGCTKVRWETLAVNVRAQRYYSKIGGREIGRAMASKDEVVWYELELGADRR